MPKAAKSDKIFFPRYFGEGTASGREFSFDQDVEGGGKFLAFGPTSVRIEVKGRHPRSTGQFEGTITLRATSKSAELDGTMNGQVVNYRGKCEVRGDRLLADFAHTVHCFFERSHAHPDRTDCSYNSSKTSLVLKSG